MNKSELIDRIAKKTQTSKAAAARIFDALFDASSGAIAEAVQAGRQVSIPGFGKFRSKERAARKGRNPQTGTEISIPASTVVSFAPAKGLRETVRSKKGGSSGAKSATAGTKSSAAGAKGASKAAKGPTAKSPGSAAKSSASGAKSSGAKSGGAGTKSSASGGSAKPPPKR